MGENSCSDATDKGLSSKMNKQLRQQQQKKTANQKKKTSQSKNKQKT